MEDRGNRRRKGQRRELGISERVEQDHKEKKAKRWETKERKRR